MPRYVILHHDTPAGYERPPHWDLMLEAGDGLRTWALPERPDRSSRMTVDALGEHRVAYLRYEGPVSGDRGTVRRWDEGTYRVESETPNRLVVILDGAQLAGRLTLSRLEATDDAAIAAQSNAEAHRWSFELEASRSATPG